MARSCDHDMVSSLVDLTISDDDWDSRSSSRTKRRGKTTDRTHIRGVSVLDVMKNSSIRIPWEARDRIIFVSHLAKYQLNLDTCTAIHLDELLGRLGLRKYTGDLSYLKVLLKKLESALGWQLRRLHEAGHVQATFRKPCTARWRPYTQSWGEDDWNGDENAPDIDDGTNSTESVGINFGDVAASGALNSQTCTSAQFIPGRQIVFTQTQGEDEDVDMEDVVDLPTQQQQNQGQYYQQDPHNGFHQQNVYPQEVFYPQQQYQGQFTLGQQQLQPHQVQQNQTPPQQQQQYQVEFTHGQQQHMPPQQKQQEYLQQQHQQAQARVDQQQAKQQQIEKQQQTRGQQLDEQQRDLSNREQQLHQRELAAQQQLQTQALAHQHTIETELKAQLDIQLAKQRQQYETKLQQQQEQFNQSKQQTESRKTQQQTRPHQAQGQGYQLMQQQAQPQEIQHQAQMQLYQPLPVSEPHQAAPTPIPQQQHSQHVTGVNIPSWVQEVTSAPQAWSDVDPNDSASSGAPKTNLSRSFRDSQAHGSSSLSEQFMTQHGSPPASTTQRQTNVARQPTMPPPTSHPVMKTPPASLKAQLNHKEWVQGVTTLAWAIRAMRCSPEATDTVAKLRTELGNLIPQAPSCSTFAILMNSACAATK
ncbi:hypothetical protein FDECE_8839 [Fusarium decemcellulare]|nr:hypothetical protein FDECE_8839 [Fusarium decemcellulare]